MIFVLAFIIGLLYHVTHFAQHPLALVIYDSLILVLAGAGQFATKLLIAVVTLYDCGVFVMSRFHARIVAYFAVAAVGCVVNRLISVVTARRDHRRLAIQPSSTTSDMKISKETAL